MDDTISRQAAINLLKKWSDGYLYIEVETNSAIKAFEVLPPAQPEIIRCKDCRWWDKYDDYDNGYCMAAKHGYWSEHWDISIRRKYKGDFYCADAEPKGEQE